MRSRRTTISHDKAREAYTRWPVGIGQERLGRTIRQKELHMSPPMTVKLALRAQGRGGRWMED